MNRVFQPRGYFTVPDGTQVSPFLNATDINQVDVPWGGLGQLSIASGRVLGRTHSAVHVHPIVTQVTYVVAGNLRVRMKDPESTDVYELTVPPGSAVVTRPGTLFQLVNDGDDTVEVLYIVSPSYVFEMDGAVVTYDDARLVSDTWEELVAAEYDVPALSFSPQDVGSRRAAALDRLRMRKAGGGAAQV